MAQNPTLSHQARRPGDYTSAEIADLCAIARGHLFRWLAAVRKGGLETLLTREKPGPKEGSSRGVSPAILDELKAQLDAGDFVTGVRAQQWHEEKHGVGKKSRRSPFGAELQPRKIPRQHKCSGKNSQGIRKTSKPQNRLRRQGEVMDDG